MNDSEDNPSAQVNFDSLGTAADDEILAALADNFGARLRSGENPRLEEYVERHPALEERIKKVLQAVTLMEQTRTCDVSADGERPGDTIGRYKLLEQIGEGGFGVVFMAEQQEPVRRKVALKMIKPGMDTRQVIARFEAERQALAVMDHSNIARVLDAGATPSGRPFFVMELVRGIPITRYCDESNLPVLERLEMFVTVCQAVQHAHTKGIIHRDIKPSNVLVTQQDCRPTVKVIDFGVAKAMGQQLTDKTLFTNFAQVIGTPLYMSPEQAERSGVDIDTRSDIYSLGVLLYELLTGSTPVDPAQLRQAAFDEVRRIIREEEPQTPSARISGSHTLPAIAAHRHIDPARLSKLVRGELDWIVMKALEKDRTRRYETANGLASDILRYLADEPITACAPSTAYRLQKFARRNKAFLAAATVVLLTLVGGIVGTTFGLVRAEQARQAEAERAEGERRARLEAQEREAESKAVLDFVRDKVFAAARPEGQAGGLGHHVTLRQAVEAALPFVEESFADQPLIQARLQSTLGASFWWLGQPKVAVEQHEKARAIYVQHLGPDHPDTLSCMLELANGYEHAGRYNDALALRQEVLKLSRARFDHDHDITIKGMSGLANSYYLAGQHVEALKRREEVLSLAKAKFGPYDRNVLGIMQNLANSYDITGRREDALKLREETFTLLKAKLGADHPDTFATMNNLAFSYDAMGRYAEALKLREETLALSRLKLGPHHRDTLTTMLNLAISYSQFGRHEEALELEVQTLELARTNLGPDHPITLQVMRNLAISYQGLGRHEEALALEEQALALTKDKFGPDDPATLHSMALVVANLISCDRSAEAVPIIDDCLRRAGGKSIDPRLIPTLFNYRLRHFEKSGDTSGCRTTAEMWECLNRTDFESLYIAACYRAVTAAILRAKDESDASNVEADRAMDWLAKAVAAGYDDVSLIEKDNDLNVLHDREDFKTLLNELQAIRNST